MDVPKSKTVEVVTKDVSGRIALGRFITGSIVTVVSSCGTLGSSTQKIKARYVRIPKKDYVHDVVRYGMHSCTKLKTGDRNRPVSRQCWAISKNE
jgi:hypothetical protein